MTGGAAGSRTIVITGASDGIGASAARILVARGYHVVVVGRSATKTEAVAHELGTPWYVADFAHLDSVRELAERLRTDVGRIDLLANNAGGVFGPDRVETEDGHEMTFQVDYLAPFLLTRLLLDRLVEARGCVINTSSVANRLFGDVDINDLDARAGTFNARRAYGTAKLEQILFTKELDRRYRAQHLSSAAFHPGVIGSSFASSRGSALGWIYQNPLSRRFLGSPDSGADTLVWLVENLPGSGCPSGGYFARRKPVRPARQAEDPELATRLWDRSAEVLQLSPKHIEENRHERTPE